MKNVLKTNEGLSLVELMVAVAVTGLLMAAAFGVLSTSIRSYQNTADQGANVQLSRNAMNEIANEIRNATAITVIATNPADLTYTVPIGAGSENHRIMLVANTIVIKNADTGAILKSMGQGRIGTLEIAQKDPANQRVFTVSISLQSNAYTGSLPTPVSTVVTTLN